MEKDSWIEGSKSHSSHAKKIKNSSKEVHGEPSKCHKEENVKNMEELITKLKVTEIMERHLKKTKHI